jgi:pyrimidine-nucleoside phosphorylase
MREHPARLIRRKRDGGELSAAEIQDLVAGVVDGSLGEAQLGAFLMAVCLSGMTAAETAALTLAMRDSGAVLRVGAGRPVIDKHSTGGVGDKTSLLLAPMAAAAGLAVPMISGRGLGHTGGTVDKLAAIPGYRTELAPGELVAIVGQCGYAMSSASAAIAPADRRMYATRDVTGTVESIPLITASILSKKLAEGLDGLVMDVKCGRAAFLPRREDAEQLRDSLVEVGAAAGLRIGALLTDMDHPLGRALGNGLEVAEVLRALAGEWPPDLREVTFALGAEMLMLGGVVADEEAATELLERLLADGVVRRVFQHNLELQGGDPRIVDDPGRLGIAPHVAPVPAARRGHVVDVDPLGLGHAIVDLGGGRRQLCDAVDPLVGVVLEAVLGTAVEPGQPLAFVHARTAAAAAAGVEAVRKAIAIGEPRRRRGPAVLARAGEAGG